MINHGSRCVDECFSDMNSIWKGLPNLNPTGTGTNDFHFKEEETIQYEIVLHVPSFPLIYFSTSEVSSCGTTCVIYFFADPCEWHRSSMKLGLEIYE